jgi:putative peptidoglycan lipid II flippase
MSEKIARSMGSVSLATFLSRLLGYLRDAMVAHAFGGGALTDAFYAAFRLSNLFRRMLGEGPLSTAFVPVFSEHMVRNERREAVDFFRALFTVLGVVLLVVTVGMWIGAPWIVEISARGFKSSDPAKFLLTVDLMRLLSPFLFFVCLAAISAAALNATGSFFIPSLAPAMLSVSTIVYVLCMRWWPGEPMRGLAVSTTVGGVFHLLALLPFLSKQGLSPRWRWNPFHPDVKRVTWLVIPAVWGLSIDQINAYVDTICASFLSEGSVTAMYNSNRLMQFALALFGTAVSTATLPHLAERVARGDWKGMKDNLSYSTRMTLAAVLPATVGLTILAHPIVRILFQHGAFTSRQSDLTSAALIGFTIGLPAYSVVKILVSAFYSMKDTKTPVKVATVCLFVNIAGVLLLMRRWGVGGMAMATSLASMVNAALLLILLRRKIGPWGGRDVGATLLRSCAASVVMAVAAWFTVRFLPGPEVVRVLSGVGVGVAAYIAAARVVHLRELDALYAVFRRRRPTPKEEPSE